ncbi:unnamed protein product [Ectocarpus sp. 6 AP-2014]
MARVVLIVSMTLSLTKTILVKDAVGPRRILTKSLARLGSHGQSSAGAQRSSTRSATSQHQQRQGSAAGANASKVRSLHRWLLSMHVTATLSLAAGVAMYTLPVSDSLCGVTHRIVGIMALLSDACLVLFLLAEVHLTNGHTRLTCWEKCAIWVSRLYACLILPTLAIFWAATTPVTANPEGTFCYDPHQEEPSDDGHSRRSISVGIAIKNLLLIVQFVLLLGLFIKPMLALQGSTPQGGRSYRRVIGRSIICTIGVAVAHVITTLLVVVALQGDSYEAEKAFQIRHIALAVRQVGTLCLTEIALPLGFTSCINDCRRVCAEKRSQGQQVEDSAALAGAAHRSDETLSAEKLPPQAP